MYKKIFLILISVSLAVTSIYLNFSSTNSHGALPRIKTVYVQPYTYSGEDIDYKTCHAPIPPKDRVPNRTKIQCVYASIEMIGRWAEEEKLMDPPLTSRSDCKGYSGPGAAAERLNKYKVKFVQSYNNKEEGRKLLRKAVAEEGRGALFDIPGHAMVIVHYDPENDDIRFVDNSDTSLKVQKWTNKQFEAKWDSWVLVVYADKDIISYKTSDAWKMPIINRKNPKKEFPRFYIPAPLK